MASVVLRVSRKCKEGGRRESKMNRRIVRSAAPTREVTSAVLTAEDGSLDWYKVVGIEFVLFAGIVLPLICGALLAR